MTEVKKSIEDTELEAEQEKTGKLIDKAWAYQQWLKEPKVKATIKSDPNLMLYRLPLTEEQREAVYKGVMRDAAKDMENLKLK